MNYPAPTPLQLAHALFVHVDLEPPKIIGPTKYGFRQVVPIAGGHFEGERLRGRVLPGGADWNVARVDGVTEIQARYTLETDDGALIYIVNEGLTTASPEVIMKLVTGQATRLDAWYFRSAPRFETAEPKYQWLQRSLFVGDLLPPDGLVARFHVYEVR
ncbi:DUF3237 domain-containing protein [Paraburkholderia sp. MM5384-R2]|uniref:DUF3237 domain-containing protein n=1 Tax=Paraburkholderia sp. MM5384-R2 TaxID=2723097 RepID=UPI001610F8BC|nr:DUF3237 domain-containing protein [Paraburkholderia sp. MM5384-R2]MBB5499403.1 hypothetical protein [Paraburkholderia sp. MM5384-R2]